MILNKVKDLYNLKDFQAVLSTANEIRTQLEKLGCFSSVTFQIENSKQPNASPSDIEITFAVKERKRLSGKIETNFGNNEVSGVVGGDLPNLFGRGEKKKECTPLAPINQQASTSLLLSPCIIKQILCECFFF